MKIKILITPYYVIVLFLYYFNYYKINCILFKNNYTNLIIIENYNFNNKDIYVQIQNNIKSKQIKKAIYLFLYSVD